MECLGKSIWSAIESCYLIKSPIIIDKITNLLHIFTVKKKLKRSVCFVYRTSFDQLDGHSRGILEMDFEIIFWGNFFWVAFTPSRCDIYESGPLVLLSLQQLHYYIQPSSTRSRSRIGLPPMQWPDEQIGQTLYIIYSPSISKLLPWFRLNRINSCGQRIR